MLRGAPFIIAFVCWLCVASLDNGFDVDWRTYKCLHVACTDGERIRSWLWLIMCFLGIGFAVMFAVISAFRSFGRFLLFLAISALVVFFMFREATFAGDGSVFDPRIMWLVATFVVFQTGAMIVAIQTKPARGAR